MQEYTRILNEEGELPPEVDMLQNNVVIDTIEQQQQASESSSENVREFKGKPIEAQQEMSQMKGKQSEENPTKAKTIYASIIAKIKATLFSLFSEEEKNYEPVTK